MVKKSEQAAANKMAAKTIQIKGAGGRVVKEEIKLPARNRLTPDEFRSTYEAKGFNGVALAAYWNLGTVRISQIVNDTKRPWYFDDAVKGLPELKKSKKAL